MFGFLKRRFLKEIEGYVSFIQLSVACKLERPYKEQYGEERGARLAAAVANRLFGKDPTHTESELALAEQLASDIMRNDEEVRYAAIMSLRTMIVTEFHTKGTEAMWRVVNTLEWMRQFGALPSDKPGPELIKALAQTLYKKYIPKHQLGDGVENQKQVRITYQPGRFSTVLLPDGAKIYVSVNLTDIRAAKLGLFGVMFRNVWTFDFGFPIRTELTKSTERSKKALDVVLTILDRCQTLTDVKRELSADGGRLLTLLFLGTSGDDAVPDACGPEIVDAITERCAMRPQPKEKLCIAARVLSFVETLRQMSVVSSSQRLAGFASEAAKVEYDRLHDAFLDHLPLDDSNAREISRLYLVTMAILREAGELKLEGVVKPERHVDLGVPEVWVVFLRSKKKHHAEVVLFLRYHIDKWVIEMASLNSLTDGYPESSRHAELFLDSPAGEKIINDFQVRLQRAQQRER